MSVEDNLKESFAGESQANRKYTAFARKADKENLPGVARLFRAVAAAETVHALAELDALGGVKGTLENLKAAKSGEEFEFKEMYPPFIENAKAASNTKAQRVMQFAMEVEKVHAELYAKAIAAVESAMIANDGQIIAVEYNKHDRYSMEENVKKFGLHNVSIVDDTSRESMSSLPVPTLSFIVATKRFEDEVEDLLRLNPKMKFVVYTLELNILSDILNVFKKYHIEQTEVIQVNMSKLNNKGIFEAKPAPWILSGEPV